MPNLQSLVLDVRSCHCESRRCRIPILEKVLDVYRLSSPLPKKVVVHLLHTQTKEEVKVIRKWRSWGLEEGGGIVHCHAACERVTSSNRWKYFPGYGYTGKQHVEVS